MNSEQASFRLMKIALFPPSLEGGGVQRVVLNLARGFADAGLDTDLVVIKPEGAFLSQVPPNVNLVSLDSARAITSVLPLMRYLRREKPDVLLAASEPVNLAAIWAKMLTNVPTRIAVMVLNTPSAYNARVLRRREKLYPILSRRFYPRADHIIAIVEGIRQDMSTFLGLPLDRIRTINTPVITPDFYERANQPVDHPWFEDDIPVILGVGRFVPQKDLPTLIRALARVRQQRAARLMLIGDGQDRPQLEALVGDLGIGDDVYMPGFIDNLPYMKRADVFVLSSLFEGLPTVLVEALACCPAIVSTDSAGGAREILQDGKCGRIVPVQDPSALAQAILETLDQPYDVNILRARAQDFTMQRIIAQYKEYLRL